MVVDRYLMYSAAWTSPILFHVTFRGIYKISEIESIFFFKLVSYLKKNGVVCFGIRTFNGKAK